MTEENDTLLLKGEEETMVARLCPYCEVQSNFNLGKPTSAAKTPPINNKNEVLSLDGCQNCAATVYFRSYEGNRNELIDQYPKSYDSAAKELPKDIKKAFDEALLCYTAGAPNGSLLMSRRALQETMNNKEAKKGDLPTQLDDLVERDIITPQLRRWAEQAQIGGKIAAHGTGGGSWGDPDKIWGDMNDAIIVIDYLRFFFDYLYVIEAQLQAKMKGHNVPASQSETDSNEP